MSEATVKISMEVVIDGKVYTANGTVEVTKGYFDGWSMIQWPITNRAAELAEVLQGKVEQRDYSFTENRR